MHKIIPYSLIVGIIGFVDAAWATGDTPSPSTITSLGYVTNAVSQKQQKIPARTSGLTESVVTAPAQAGGVTSDKGVYQNTGAYNNSTKTHLVEANTVNTAIQNGLSNHLEQVNDSNGTLWRIKAVSSNDVYIPHSGS